MKILIAFLIGVLTWPVLEYILHRFLGHVLKVKTEFKKQHTRHHAETNYFAPNFLKLVAAVPVSIASLVLVSLIAGSWAVGGGFSLGFVLMYGFYEWTHWSFHFQAPRTALGMRLRKHHFTHHFHNSKMDHGVTSTLFDHLFGTYLEIPVVKVPRQFMLPWLMAPGSSEIDPKYSADFQIK